MDLSCKCPGAYYNRPCPLKIATMGTEMPASETFDALVPPCFFRAAVTGVIGTMLVTNDYGSQILQTMGLTAQAAAILMTLRAFWEADSGKDAGKGN